MYYLVFLIFLSFSSEFKIRINKELAVADPLLSFGVRSIIDFGPIKCRPSRFDGKWV
jgi:hypothetical protein